MYNTNELPKFELTKTINRIWDVEVPIIVDEEKNKITAFLTKKIEEPEEYNELCYLLLEANCETEFNLHINSPGGVVDSAFMVVNAIKHSKARVKAILSGTVASAGTLIALACDELQVNEHVSFMIHNYSGGLTGKGHEMKARHKFTDSHLNEAFNVFYKGFLTPEEITRVIDGTDLWMDSAEVTRRWENKRNNS